MLSLITNIRIYLYNLNIGEIVPLFDLYFFMFIFGYFIIKFFLLDPIGIKFGKYILKRFIIVLIFNLIIYHWSGFTLCENDFTKNIKVNEKMLKAFAIAGGIMCIGYLCSKSGGFYDQVYYPKFSSLKLLKVRELNWSEIKNLHDSNELRKLILFNVSNLKRRDLMIGAFNQYHESFISKWGMMVTAQSLTASHVAQLDFNLKANVYKTGNSLCDPFRDRIIHDIKMINLSMAKMKKQFVLHEYNNSFKNTLTFEDLVYLTQYYSYCSVELNNIYYLIRDLESPTNVIINASISIHAIKQNIYKLSSKNINTNMSGLGDIAVDLKAILPENKNLFIDRHHEALNLTNLYAKMKEACQVKMYERTPFDVSLYMDPINICRLYPDTGVVMLKSYDLGLILAYSFLKSCNLVLGTYNPIPDDLAFKALKNFFFIR